MRVIHLLRKPLGEPTVASNAQTHGTGGINILGTRVECEGGSPTLKVRKTVRGNTGSPSGWGTDTRTDFATPRKGEEIGRWPANLVLEEGPVCDDLDSQVPSSTSTANTRWVGGRTDSGFVSMTRIKAVVPYEDEGGPSRFFRRIKNG